MKNSTFFPFPHLQTIHSQMPEMAYHSFNDVELFEPNSPPRRSSTYPEGKRSENDDRPRTASRMQRQDSGYESYTTSPRNSTSHSRPNASRRISNASAATGAGPSSRPRTRPTTKRSASHNTWTSTPLQVVQPTELKQQTTSYFQFPPPDPQHLAGPLVPSEPAPVPLPPQTTHYWTSDSTRRLEYATIDASCRGVKGWMKRNLVPGCFTAKEDRHIAFDDDTGSVRRYRLELEPEEKALPFSAACRRKGWQFWGESSNTRR